jgi:hypothetical protein
MAGYGYTHVTRSGSISAKLVGGYALTSFQLASTAGDAHHDNWAGERYGQTSATRWPSSRKWRSGST